ncbi:DUF445 domain-containing protein [Amycolatopsis aidingensis]|uniref:DUF445 domain-containing protein n=1 Tax=Amycolatopsis aidingensis TaxID=2842453 RepID=UPI001C0E307A|nr:DUF445 domain-containing protein [Amycolatopsis aidingensis]
MDAVLDELARHWPGYAALPLLGALIGYLAARLAVELLLRPVDPLGGRPPLGWQGVVPRHAGRVAARIGEAVTTGLRTPGEVVAGIDPDRLTREVEQPLLRAVDDIARDVLEEYHPRLWEALPAMAQELAIKQLQAAAPDLVRRLLGELATAGESVLDARQLAVDRLSGDRALLVRLVRTAAQADTAFLTRFGVLLGLLLGVVQAVVVAATGQPVLLLAFAVLIGVAAALPGLGLAIAPRRERGEVPRQYGELVAREVLTVPTLIDAVLRGPHADRLLAMIQRTVAASVREQRAAVALTVGGERLREMKRAAARRVAHKLPDIARHAEGYLTEAIDVAGTVERRLRALPDAEYERLLRPAFRLHLAWLGMAGGLLGAGFGVLYLLLLSP